MNVLVHCQAENLCRKSGSPPHYAQSTSLSGSVGRNHQKTDSNPNPATLWPVTFGPCGLGHSVCGMTTTTIRTDPTRQCLGTRSENVLYKPSEV